MNDAIRPTDGTSFRFGAIKAEVEKYAIGDIVIVIQDDAGPADAEVALSRDEAGALHEWLGQALGSSAGAEDMSGKQLLEKFSEYTRAIPMGAFNTSNGESHYNWASYHHRILAGMLGLLPTPSGDLSPPSPEPSGNRELLRRACEYVDGMVKHFGPCDHDVGICICQDEKFAAELRVAAAGLSGEPGGDAARLDWLRDNEAKLEPHRESFGVDDPESGYTVWWQVVKRGKSLSGHPLGDLRAAIDAAMARSTPTKEVVQSEKGDEHGR